MLVIIVSCLSLVAGYGLALALSWRRARGPRSDRTDEVFSAPGASVEMDCRKCGQFNQVPSHRLRDRPKCGRCKSRLMPGKRIVLHSVSQMQGTQCAELEAVWASEDRLWQRLAEHLAKTVETGGRR